MYQALIARFGDSGDAQLQERVYNASEWLAEAQSAMGQRALEFATIEDTLRRNGSQMPEAERARLINRLGPMALGRLARKWIDRVKGVGR